MERKSIVIVLDGVGIGALPDADKFDDAGAHSLLHVALAVPDLHLPTLRALGLGNAAQISDQSSEFAEEIPGINSVREPLAAFGKMASVSPGKDSIYGHWELMGCVVDTPFSVYPSGFPEEFIQRFSERIGVGLLGNLAASGTKIIEELGEDHLRTGKPIVYTSADSVLQIAAHQDVIPLDRLYEICAVAREMTNPLRIGRVIARPFVGTSGRFVRTNNRHDFGIPPTSQTVLDLLQKNQIDVVGLGKISDLFASRGVSQTIKTHSNHDTMEKVIEQYSKTRQGLIFANCNDTDTAYGHRRDTLGYAQALDDVDKGLSLLLPLLGSNDLLIVCADHGCDPTLTRHTDHTREHVPLLVYSPAIQSTISLGLRKTFADVGKTLTDWFRIDEEVYGTSFLPLITHSG